MYNSISQLSIPIKEQCVFVGLFAFYRPHEISYFAALPPSPRAGAVAGGPARARKHAQREHARACRPTSQRKNRTLMPFKNKTVRAHSVVYVTAEIFKKKGKRKPTCHFPSLVYSLPSLGVFTFRIVLNRILHKSSLLAPMESRRTRRSSFTAEERLERRREQDRRRHAARSTKTKIMTVHVNPIMEAAPSQRRIVSIAEASNQLLFHFQKFFFE